MHSPTLRHHQWDKFKGSLSRGAHGENAGDAQHTGEGQQRTIDDSGLFGVFHEGHDEDSKAGGKSHQANRENSQAQQRSPINPEGKAAKGQQGDDLDNDHQETRQKLAVQDGPGGRWGDE